MAVPIAVASTVLAVILVVALAREMRLRRALESLLRRLLSYWRTHEKPKPRDVDRPADDGERRLQNSDDRLVEMAREHAARQAESQRQMTDLQKQVAEGSRQLVESDAKAART